MTVANAAHIVDEVFDTTQNIYAQPYISDQGIHIPIYVTSKFEQSHNESPYITSDYLNLELTNLPGLFAYLNDTAGGEYGLGSGTHIDDTIIQESFIPSFEPEVQFLLRC